MERKNSPIRFENILRQRPNAYAFLNGAPPHSGIHGGMRLYQMPFGTLVAIEMQGLPVFENPCESPIFALHIHEGGGCTGDADDFFSGARSHYNPYRCPHPYHAGDLPPLFGAGGYAFSVFLTDRFTADEVIGKTVILHGSPDDFVTQPAGNAGVKLACGEIMRGR